MNLYKNILYKIGIINPIVKASYSKSKEILTVTYLNQNICKFENDGHRWYIKPFDKRCDSGTEKDLNLVYNYIILNNKSYENNL